VVLFFLAVFSAPSARAYWIGNPAAPVRGDNFFVETLYDVGRRRLLNPDDSKREIRLDSRRLSLQAGHGLGRSFELSGRLLPFTGRMDVNGVSFDPPVFGAGSGVRFSPDWGGPLRVGVLASWDWNYGTQRRRYTDPQEASFFNAFIPDTKKRWYRVNWTEGTLAAGASAAVGKNLDLYGGFSYLRTKVYLYVAGNQTNWVSKRMDGFFGGFTARLGRGFSSGFEVHTGNETLYGFSLRYQGS